MSGENRSYRVEFAIDVYADSPEQACWRAWGALSQPGSMLPIGTVTSPDGSQTNIDLEEVKEEHRT